MARMTAAEREAFKKKEARRLARERKEPSVTESLGVGMRQALGGVASALTGGGLTGRAREAIQERKRQNRKALDE